MTDKIFYNFPIAIFRQVRTDNKGAIKHVEDAINEAVKYALFVAYQKLMPPQANPNEYNAGVFNELTDVMGFCVNDPKDALRRWAGVYRKYKNYSVFVGVDKGLLFDFRDNLVYKTDFEIIQLLTFLAIRSIIGAGHGNMRVKHIPWHYVLSRMAGHEKAVNNLDTLPKFISKYASRRYHDKLIKALCERWHMQYYGTRLGKRVAPLFTFSQSMDMFLTLVKLLWIPPKRMTIPIVRLNVKCRAILVTNTLTVYKITTGISAFRTRYLTAIYNNTTKFSFKSN